MLTQNTLCAGQLTLSKRNKVLCVTAVAVRQKKQK